MSLQDEIEKIIQAEQQKLEAYWREDTEFCTEYTARQKQRFQPLYALLMELAQAIEPSYLQGKIFAGKPGYSPYATLNLGRDTGQGFSADISWRITCDESPAAVMWYRENVRSNTPGRPNDEPGFCVDETTGPSRETHIFADERLVMEYLVPKVAKRVANYRYWANPIRGAWDNYGQGEGPQPVGSPSNSGT